MSRAGTELVLVRFSRGGGPTAPLPCVLGIALPHHAEHRRGDVLFATTGRSPVGRFLLVPRWAAAVSTTTYSTLQPYRTPTGPVVLAARPTSEGDDVVVRLAVARPAGRWHDFGHVVVSGDAEHGSDRPISFDPFLNAIPGLDNYAWARRIREGAYAAVRRTRRNWSRSGGVSGLHHG